MTLAQDIFNGIIVDNFADGGGEGISLKQYCVKVLSEYAKK